MEDLNANSDFREFERIRRLVISCVSLQITSLFIEERFLRMRGLGLQSHMLWLSWIVHEASFEIHGFNVKYKHSLSG